MTVQGLAWVCTTTFAPARTTVEPQVQPSRPTDADDMDKFEQELQEEALQREEKRKRDDAKTENATPGAEVDQGPPWAECILDYSTVVMSQTAGGEVDAELQTRMESWIMRGERENVDAFKSWQIAEKGETLGTMRCMQTSAKAIEGTSCLECIPRGSGSDGSFHLQSTYAQLRGSAPGHVVMTLTTTIGQCPGFCKSGSVSL
eukprot:CAMPEP_0178389002 /NCGR_PEP_ID=MMETSP0689_2-20121128/9884_1 /TAXON_ID=160604 /ORGANISM="Amphidinium massartii, Strain CS-259" /LENGTH=202 /DNA_ID=CAMNT_0020009423 /DNA_START=34 /DNA_END=643 /DNA_ORIENTATION=+